MKPLISHKQEKQTLHVIQIVKGCNVRFSRGFWFILVCAHNEEWELNRRSQSQAQERTQSAQNQTGGCGLSQISNPSPGRTGPVQQPAAALPLPHKQATLLSSTAPCSPGRESPDSKAQEEPGTPPRTARTRRDVHTGTGREPPKGNPAPRPSTWNHPRWTLPLIPVLPKGSWCLKSFLDV